MSEQSTVKTTVKRPKFRRRTLAAVGASIVTLGLIAFWGDDGALQSGLQEPQVTPGAATVRRLSEGQYKRTIAQVFDSEIRVPGRFDPPVRVDSMLAIGSASATVTASGLEQHLARAEVIAKEVLSPEHRDKFLKCQPVAANEFDEGCASLFLNEYGRLIFRRPLTDAELSSALEAARKAAQTFSDFYAGLQYGLMSQLISPAFIYRSEHTEVSAEGVERLDAYSLASRISFFLWDSPPDAELLDAAASGDLQTQKGLQYQVDRLIASPKFEAGVRAFFWDMFGFDQFVGLGKDTKLFPRYSVQLRDDVEEQSLRTIIDLLVTQQGDYRDLFTTKTTYINRNLASLFRVPVTGSSEDGWEKFTFADDAKRAGLLTLPAFLMLDTTHEGRSSPTIRGKNVRELLLCQEVPPPPGDVNFDIVENTNSPLRTARERLDLHNQDPVCAGCHAVTDPIGLSFENYDPIGQYRVTENGVVIDPSGTFDGVPISDAITLQDAMVNSGKLTECVAKRAYEYGVGRTAASQEYRLMSYFNSAFSEKGYKFVELMRLIATSQAFKVATLENSEQS